MIYITGVTVFLSVIIFLVIMLLLLETWLIRDEKASIIINDDSEKKIYTQNGTTLLAALSQNSILLPSACGGKGSCGMCKCFVKEGGGDVLPTEFAHLSYKEKKNDVRMACQVKVKDDMKITIPAEIFSIKRYYAKVVSNKNVATFIKHTVLRLDPGQKIALKAGSYMQIDIPQYKLSYKEFDVEDEYKSDWEKFGFFNLVSKSTEEVFRAYSIANIPSEKNIIEFTIRIATPPPKSTGIPPGVGSSYIFNLKSEDRVTLSGPYGDFFVEKTAREACFVGGGAGMAPMRSHIFDQLEVKKTTRKLSFWYGARSRQEMFFDNEFKKLEENNDNFVYKVALSDPQPEDHWDGLTGFIHQCLYDCYLAEHEDPSEIKYYLCGPPMMIDAVINMLDDLGVEPEMIHYDKF